jgi:hypothetical protein
VAGPPAAPSPEVKEKPLANEARTKAAYL